MPQDNQDRFDALQDQYGGKELIPNDVLYKFLLEIREDLLNVAKLGIDHIPNSPLGKEVRRRCQTDLMWMARYFTWVTNPASDNGIRPFEDNIFDEEFYIPFTQLFVRKDPTKPLNHQSKIKRRMLLWPRGGAKALDVNTLIPTPRGFRKMLELQVGDEVYSETGEPVKITATSPIFENHNCYEVEFSSGEKIVADEGHLWWTDSRKDRDRAHRSVRGLPSPSSKTTKQIRDSLYANSQKKEHNHRVILSRPIKGTEKELSIPPYVLGCWLGDGTSASASITCHPKDVEIIENIRAEGIPVCKADSGKYLWRMNGGESHPDFKKRYTGVPPALRNLGVLNNKHIPEEYLWASFEQRLSLLQGLMDTGGTVSRDGKCRFSNSNRRLSEQVKQLAASLGLRAWVSERDAVINGKKVGTDYYVGFASPLDFPVFRLSRKQSRISKRNTFNYRQIVAVRPVESRPVKCITVDSPTHLYLAGEGFIPTHNSTFDHVDTVQWILCFPSIRVLYLTAEKNLAEGFVGEIKGHFYFKEDPTWMNLFWPEFCVEEGKAGAANEFTCPVYAAKKTGRKEPTVYASSVGKNKAGWRYELIKADDAVSDTNSETSVLCQKISNALMLAEKLLALGGYYIDFIGTRYADEDHYGVLLSKNEGEIVTTEGRGWVLTENADTNTKILVGRAIQIKPEVKEKLEREGRPVTYQEAKEEGCILLLPHLMSFAWCMADLTLDEKSFEGQRNQNPRSASQVGFDLAMMVRATVPFNMLPKEGPCSQVWDLASSQKKGRDFTVGTSVIWGEEEQTASDGRKTGVKQTVGTVRKVKRAKMLPHQIVQAIIELIQEEHPFIVAIENAQGASYLKDSIMTAAYRTGDPYVIRICAGIDWFTPDQQKDAKRIRMGSLHPWISEGRFRFANYCMECNPHPHNKIDILYKEFGSCMFDHHHDDIPDNLGYQTRYAPQATQAIVENNRDLFSTIDRQGWGEIYDEDHQTNVGPAYFLNDEGKLELLDAYKPQVSVELFSPEPDVSDAVPGGMRNVLGAGVWG